MCVLIYEGFVIHDARHAKNNVTDARRPNKRRNNRFYFQSWGDFQAVRPPIHFMEGPKNKNRNKDLVGPALSAVRYPPTRSGPPPLSVNPSSATVGVGSGWSGFCMTDRQGRALRRSTPEEAWASMGPRGALDGGRETLGKINTTLYFQQTEGVPSPRCHGSAAAGEEAHSLRRSGRNVQKGG